MKALALALCSVLTAMACQNKPESDATKRPTAAEAPKAESDPAGAPPQSDKAGAPTTEAPPATSAVPTRGDDGGDGKKRDVAGSPNAK